MAKDSETLSMLKNFKILSGEERATLRKYAAIARKLEDGSFADKAYDLMRERGYTTHGQSVELSEAIAALLTAPQFQEEGNG